MTPAEKLLGEVATWGRRVSVAEMEADMGPEMTRKFRAHMAGLRAVRACPTYPDCEHDCYMTAYEAAK